MAKSGAKVKKRLNKKAMLVMLLVIYLIGMLIYYLFTLPIKSIIITGNTNVTDTEILERANIRGGAKILTLSTRKVEGNIEEISMVAKASVKKSITGKLIITIEEKSILFYDALNSYYVLIDGTNTTSVSNSLGVPTLINYVPSDILSNLITKMQEMDLDILALVSEIEYSPSTKDEVVIDENRFILRMNDGNYVYINLANFSNINRYKDLYAALDDGVKGVFNLDSSSDKILFQSFDALSKESDVSDELSD